MYTELTAHMAILYQRPGPHESLLRCLKIPVEGFWVNRVDNPVSYQYPDPLK